jgi:hypothetical protein
VFVKILLLRLSVLSEIFLILSICGLVPWPVAAAKAFNFSAALVSSSPGLASRAAIGPSLGKNLRMRLLGSREKNTLLVHQVWR